MGPGFKYHIVSISAIFFALTIGLVVGSVFVSPSLANRQEHLISRLQTTLNTDVEEKRQELKQYKECLAEISPLAMRGRMRNVVVAIVQVGDYPDAAARVSDAVALGDPRAIEHLTLTSALDRSAEEIQQSLSALRAGDPTLPADRDALILSIATALSHGDSPTTSALAQLEREGFVRLTADDSYVAPAGIVIIVGGSRNLDSARAGRVDVPLIRALVKSGATVVACEPRDAVSSDMVSYRVLKADITTIDNVDTDIGECALVLAYLGSHGDYGVKAGAAHLLPPLPESGK